MWKYIEPIYAKLLEEDIKKEEEERKGGKEGEKE